MKRRLAFLLYSLLMIVLFFCLLVMIRAKRPDRQTRTGVRFDEFLGWAPDPPAQGEFIVGQRRNAVDTQRSHIVFIGDSVGFGTGLTEEDTAAYFLGRMVSHAQVLNLSVTGYAIDQYFLALSRELALLRPVLVIVAIYTGNDYQGTTWDNNYGYRKPIFKVRGDDIVLERVPISRYDCVYVFGHSLLFYLLWKGAVMIDEWAQSLGRPHGGHRFAVNSLLLDICGSTVIPDDEGAKLIEILLYKIASLVDANGAETLFVLLPDKNDFVDPHYHQNTKERRLVFFQNLLQKLPFRVFDLYESVAHSPYCAPGGAETYQCKLEGFYMDSAHMDKEGQMFFANRLYEYIRDTYHIE